MPEELQQSKNSLTTYKDDIARNKADGWPDLSAQEKAFAFAYLETYKHNDAAEEVGLARSSGIRLLRKPLVNAYITEIQSEYQRRSVVDADFVRTQWLQLLPKVMGEEEVPIVLSDGSQLEARKFHAADSAKVLGELSKSTKFYEGGSGNAGNVEINIDLGALGISNEAKEKIINHEGD